MIKNSIKFRQHPGGVPGWVKFVKFYVSISVISSAFLLLFALIFMFTDDIKIEVRSIEAGKVANEAQQVFRLTHENKISTMQFKARNVLDWIAFDRFRWIPFGFFSSIFTFLISWQLLKIFNSLELANPFTLKVAKRIRLIGYLLIANSMVVLLRFFYMNHVVSKLSNKTYMIDMQSYAADINSFKIGILVIIISYIYTRGIAFQNEQELTV